jgi:hypothetical protein
MRRPLLHCSKCTRPISTRYTYTYALESDAELLILVVCSMCIVDLIGQVALLRINRFALAHGEGQKRLLQENGFSEDAGRLFAPLAADSEPPAI